MKDVRLHFTLSPPGLSFDILLKVNWSKFMLSDDFAYWIYFGKCGIISKSLE